MGINPQDNRINYQLLVDQSVATPEQRQGNFMQNLRNIISTSQVPQQSQAVSRSPSTNPPVESMSPSTSTAFRNSDDIRDAYIAGKITTDVYHERMRAIGEDI
jgi:hypothetical protein